jgi:glycine/D-amino acid oxidase-like deaminating enzyme
VRVVIVGAGIIGAASAYSLAKRGVEVVLLDAGDAPAGASARCDGMLMLSNKEPRDALKALRAIEEWKAVLPVVGDVQFEPLRTILVALDEATEQKLLVRAHELREAGLAVREMSGQQCREEDPGLSDDVRYGFVVEDSWDVQPMVATVQLLRAAETLGAVVRRGVRVRRVQEGVVHTDAGVFAADEVLLAAGPWAGALMEGSDHVVPIEPRRGHLLVAERRASDLVRCGALDGGYMTAVHSKDPGLHVVPNIERTRGGTVLLGTSRERVGFDDTPSVDVMRRIGEEVTRLYPGLRGCRVIRAWVGFRPWTPDKQPMVGRLAPGLAIAAGHEGEGIVYAPFTGERIAEVLVEDRPGPPEWDPLRFAADVAGAVR